MIWLYHSFCFPNGHSYIVKEDEGSTYLTLYIVKGAAQLIFFLFCFFLEGDMGFPCCFLLISRFLLWFFLLLSCERKAHLFFPCVCVHVNPFILPFLDELSIQFRVCVRKRFRFPGKEKTSLHTTTPSYQISFLHPCVSYFAIKSLMLTKMSLFVFRAKNN